MKNYYNPDTQQYLTTSSIRIKFGRVLSASEIKDLGFYEIVDSDLETNPYFNKTSLVIHGNKAYQQYDIQQNAVSVLDRLKTSVIDIKEADDDAAAAALSVAVGEIYKTTSGTLRTRLS